jgi:hypothetical protein
MNHTGVASTGDRRQALKNRASFIESVELVNIQPIYHNNVRFVIASCLKPRSNLELAVIGIASVALPSTPTA